MVFDDLWLHLRGRLEPERFGICHRGLGCAFKARANEPRRCASSFSRPRQTAAGTRNAVGLFRFLAIPDYLVRKSSGGDRLVSGANARRLGRDNSLGSNPPFRISFSVSTIPATQARSEQTRDRRRTGIGNALDRFAVDAWACVYKRAFSR